MTLGGSFHLDQVNIHSDSINNGSFVFPGTETGSDFADYLLGIATTYEQGDASPFYIRNHYVGLFGQDSWQVRSNLALTYGVRWDVFPPWREKYNQLNLRSGRTIEGLSGRAARHCFPRRRPHSLYARSHHVDQLRASAGNFLLAEVRGRRDGKVFGGPGKSSSAPASECFTPHSRGFRRAS